MPDLLPPNATPLERAFVETGKLISSVPVSGVKKLWNPQTCPIDFLPWLAWSLSVDDWSESWTEQQKRDAIANSIAVHRIKGTVGAVKKALAAIGYHVELDENTGTAFTFKLLLDLAEVNGVDSAAYKAAIVAAKRTKPARSKLIGIDAWKNVENLVRTAVVQTRGDLCEIEFSGEMPYIYKQPAGKGVAPGAAFSLSVGFIASGESSIQWYLNDTAIAGATSATYSVEVAGAGDIGNYFVTVTNEYGSTTSNTAVVASAPAFITQPTGYSGLWGYDVVLSVDVVGSSPLSFQWYKDGAKLAGANATIFKLSKVDESFEGAYVCAATNPNGTTYSKPAVVDIYFSAPEAPVVTNEAPNRIDVLLRKYADTRIDVSSYELQYSIDGGAWETIYTGLFNSGSYIYQHYVLRAGNYLYRCRVHHSSGRASEWSESAAYGVDSGITDGIYLGLSLGDASSYVKPLKPTGEESFDVGLSLGGSYESE